MDKRRILETVRMLDQENLDIRTVTLGISLLDCIDKDGEAAREKIYNKIIKYGKHLVDSVSYTHLTLPTTPYV